LKHGPVTTTKIKVAKVRVQLKTICTADLKHIRYDIRTTMVE